MAAARRVSRSTRLMLSMSTLARLCVSVQVPQIAGSTGVEPAVFVWGISIEGGDELLPVGSAWRRIAHQLDAFPAFCNRYHNS